ncbi:MAG: hypothetical protein J1E01_08205 [Acetatifactor sp.]|nr:hypothetical protein [Acetatifactor sp.]
MNNKIVRQALTRIAEHEGISENEVLMEMQRAILEGYNNSPARQLWEDLFGIDTIPRPEEFIARMMYIVAK